MSLYNDYLDDLRAEGFGKVRVGHCDSCDARWSTDFLIRGSSYATGDCTLCFRCAGVTP